MTALLHDIIRLLNDGEALAVATVVSHDGSTPRETGAKMAVRADGSILGTVGGGLLEARTMEVARALLDEPAGHAAILAIDLTNELAAGTDMICGGHVTLFLEHLAPDSEAARAWAEALDILGRGGWAEVVTRFGGDPPVVQGHAAREAEPGGTAAGEASSALAMQGLEGQLVERLRPDPTLYIFGAGHVSQPTAAMGAAVGFRTVILDDRADFANAKRFPHADEIAVLPDFEDCFAGRAPGTEDFIVIVTRGHLHDRTVLAQSLATPARYVGMIGSRKKRDAIYDSLLADGVAQADIDRCHCPIGLSIGAQTPEEIAVSIVAELIRCRAGAQG